jgi:folylpolyglutamate synthase/dihydropteroate synthase
VAKQTREIESFIRERLPKKYHIEGIDFSHSGSCDMFLFQEGDVSLGPLKLGLLGDHQSSNAACATSMVLHLAKNNWKMDPKKIRQGLEKATNPGRLERWTHSAGNEIWLDVAHNPDAIAKMVQYFYVRKQKQFQTVFGCSSDKPFDEMIESLRPITKDFHWVRTPTTRSWNPEDKKLEDPLKCLQVLIRRKQFPVLVTGSFYHVGVIRKKLPKLGFKQ